MPFKVYSTVKKTPELYSHQKETVTFLRNNPRALVASDCGTGKTLSILTAIDTWRSQGKTLVLAPLSLLDSAWRADAERFLPHLKLSVAYAKNRQTAFDESGDIIVTNIDALRWLGDQKAKFFDQFHAIIVDESTAIKHRTSQRSRALKKIKKHFARRYIMTGTFIGTSITDAWNQICFLDDGDRLGRSFSHFRNSTCVFEQTGKMANMGTWHDRPGSEDAVADLISDITIRHLLEECVEMPERIQRTIGFQMSKTHRTLYLKMQKEAVLAVGEKEIVAVNAAVLATKMLQIASGAVYGENGEYAVVDTSRYGLIIDLVEEAKHSVVFFNWRHQRIELCKEATKRGIAHAVIDGTVTGPERASIVKAYQTGLYQTLFIHPKSAAHGITLTRGTRTIWTSPPYEPDILRQGNHRIYRIGQTQRTETLLIAAEDSREDKVYQTLLNRDEKMSHLLEILL